MSVNTTTRAKFSFKKLLGKSHISNGVQFYSESRPNQVWIDSTEIVSKNIPKDPQQAVNDGLVEFVEADLSVIGASNGVGFDVLFPSNYNGFFGTSAQGDPIRDHTQIIDQKNNIDDGKATSSHNGGYVYALEDSNGNTISVGAPEGWLLDPVSTVLTSEQEISNLDGGTVKVYVYTGQTLREELDSIATGGGFQGTTDDIVEGSTNLYFTDERAQDAALSAVTGTNGLTWTYDDAADSAEVTLSDLDSFTTDDLSEGSTNLYFTDERAQDAAAAMITGGTNISTNYDDGTDTFTINAPDEDIQDAVFNNVLSGTQTLITVTYDDANNEVDYVVDDDISNFDLSNVTTDDISEGSTNLYYTDTRVKNDFQAGGDIIYNKNTLSGQFDLSTASFSGTSFGVGSEDAGPTGVQFNSDGTKMFVVGESTNTVYEYDLTTGFDLSTASFSGTSFDVSSQDSAPRGVAFNSDGTKMFVVGNSTNTVYEYDLTTGFDLSTASFSNTSFDVQGFETTPLGVRFNSDGTKMFVIGNSGDNVYEIDLTTGFDLSTASYSGTSFDVSSEDGGPTGVQFNSDGTKMFVTGTKGSSVYEYDLTTGFDLSTASFSGTSFDVSSEDSVPQGVTFNGVGTKMFVVGTNGDSIYEYDLGSPAGPAKFSLDVSALSPSDLFGSKTSDDLPEGSSNLYFTDERVDDRVSSLLVGGTNVGLTYDDAADSLTIDVSDENIQDAVFNNVLSGTQTLISVTYDDANNEVNFVVESDLSQYDFGNVSSDDISEGSSSLFFTEERAQDAAAAMITGGTNITTSYDDGTDTFTINAPDEDIQDAIYNNVLSGNQTRITVTYDDANNEVDYVVDDDLSNYSFANVTTDVLAEGSTNLYYTDERVDDRVNNLLVGGTNINLTYDDGANTLTIATTDVTVDVSEDDSTVVADVGDINFSTGLDVTDDTDGTVTVDMDLGEKSTDNLPEGSTNLYYTDERAQDAAASMITGGTNITTSYDDATDTFTIDNDVRFGSATFSGNPPKKEFDIPHGLGQKPTSWTITAVTDDASAFSHATADATSITVVYDTVPPVGTDNLELNYSLLV